MRRTYTDSAALIALALFGWLCALATLIAFIVVLVQLATDS